VIIIIVLLLLHLQHDCLCRTP